ncbi:LLM class flavin-dependent oxidoreductase [Rhodopseudomonas sp. HC1]|uniref:LLM class flavin-dependent oxidoreductase n=1 Tax=Rhodopseudomonas infernalis TaxID=2897386 RepID=UPI001EE942E5|nr:LLM class flavin-dependent oxidoreductase [Rhodopseudomonas infernalis]MCG6204228.1 LLM class flavin-dependent oxidoreductase [Rhodopseudomonas infernalis]
MPTGGNLPKLSVRLHGGLTARECVELAEVAETAGFASLWFAENAFARGILPSAAACAVATRRIAIGAGVFNPFSRHPTLMAMEVAALDELSGGRTMLGIGAGIASAVRKLGLDPEKPAPALRDTVVILRKLFAGETVDHPGAQFSARGVKLEHPTRADLPILVAGRGEITSKMSGELADGVLISNMCSLPFASRTAQRVNAGRSAGGRSGAAHAVQYMPCSVDADEQQAVSRAKFAVAEMLTSFWRLGERVPSARDAILSEGTVSADEYERAVQKLQAGGSPEQLDARIARAFVLCGTPESCLARAAEYAAAGVTELALTFSGPTQTDQMRLLGDALRPAGS